MYLEWRRVLASGVLGACGQASIGVLGARLASVSGATRSSAGVGRTGVRSTCGVNATSSLGRGVIRVFLLRGVAGRIRRCRSVCPDCRLWE